MNFALPSALFWALLAVPVVFFYILKVRMRRTETSTTLFWNQIFDEKPPRSIWEHFRHFLSLLAQLAMLALLVIALADPFFSWQLKSARHVALIIDPSASMQATDVVPNRFAAAIHAAEAIAEGIRERDRMVIIVAGEHPRIACGMTDHVPTLKRTLRDLRAADVPTNLTSAVDLAQRLLSEHPLGEIILLTDGCSDDIEDVRAHKQVNLSTFGTEAANVGMTQFQVRRSLIDPLGYEVLTTIRNASPDAVECRLEIELAGSPVDVIPLTLKPNEIWTKSLEKTSLTGGELIARLTRIQPKQGDSKSSDSEHHSPNQLALDDTAWAILPAREIQNVLLITPDNNLFLKKVFEANPFVKLQVMHELPATFPPETVVVLDQIVPAEFPAGKFWVIAPASASSAWEFEGDLTNPILTDIDKTSHMMTHVQLENVLIPKARKLKFKQPHKVLVGAVTGDPVYVEVKQAATQLLVLAIDLQEGDLTFRTAFPILATNALSWFSGEAGAIQEAVASGPAVQMPLQRDEDNNPESYLLRAPDGSTSPLLFSQKAPRPESKTTPEEKEPASAVAAPELVNTLTDTLNNMVTVGPLQQVGIWSIEAPASSTSASGAASNSTSAASKEEKKTILQFACNLANPRETEIRVAAPSEQVPREHVSRAGWLTRPLWFYFVIAALLLTTAEWALFQRRMIR